MTLGEKLKQLRNQKGLSLDELAKELNTMTPDNEGNITKGAISRWENDSREPTNTKLSAYAKYFNVSLDWLLGLSPSMRGGYYEDPEAAEYAEYVRTNPNLRIMFSAAKDVSKETLQKTVEYIEFLKSKEERGSDD